MSPGSGLSGRDNKQWARDGYVPSLWLSEAVMSSRGQAHTRPSRDQAVPTQALTGNASRVRTGELTEDTLCAPSTPTLSALGGLLYRIPLGWGETARDTEPKQGTAAFNHM
ncbi:hypothetical protein NDU88_003364 [Pleurodeles waltl]|uniref:Uncharacterized protein n=1 Tax=Pleurodeles waltl TaxID=8319 RepID=A0AAV7W4I7_PLEWA|nr:hypothetical protein NDU88_003364 [Pleurodeles waltl]